MKTSRRQFLQTTGVGLGALATLPRILRAAPAAGAAATTTGGPSLLFTEADLPRIRATLARPEFAAYWQASQGADLAADEHFLRDELNLANLSKDLGRAGKILLRCAFVNAVAPDSRQVRIARLALSRIMDFPRWGWLLEDGKYLVGYMQCPVTCIATILASDWLGDALSTEEREALVRRLGDEGGPACHRAVYGMTYHDKAGKWTMTPPSPGETIVDVSRWPEILDQTNIRIIATSGLAAVACFLKGRHPEAERWSDASVASLRLFASRMPADDSFVESIGYWSGTFTLYALAVDLLRRVWGADERGVLDFPAMARYALAMAAPTIGQPIDCIDIGDAARSATAIPLSWIGREFRDGTSQALIARPGTVMVEDAFSCWAAIWFDASVPARIAADVTLDRQSAPGLVLSRSGWKLEDSIVCLRSGGPGNHEHADRNSVIFMAHGERLLNDPLHASYPYTQPKWLLRLTEAHTAVLINDRGHVYHNGHEGTNASTAVATLVDYRVGLDWMRATSDATDAYRRAGLPVQRVVRTLVFLKPEVLVLYDEVSLTEPGTVQIRFQVYNDDGHGQVQVDAKTFLITRPQASLFSRFASHSRITANSGRLNLPVEGNIYPFAEIVSASATEHRILTVCTAAPKGAEHGSIALTVDAKAWRVRGSHRGRELAMKIEEALGGRAPVISF